MEPTIIDKRKNGYIENIHFVYFNFLGSGGKKNKKNKELFLTYIGVLRVLFSSRNQSVDKFTKWATKILFTVQMGTIEQKNAFIGGLVGVSPEAVKSLRKKLDIDCEHKKD